MSCSIHGRLLPLAAGGDLPAFLLASVERHAGRCEACAARLERLRNDRERLLALGEPDSLSPEEEAQLGENFWLEIRRELRSEGLVGWQGERRSRAGAPLPAMGRLVWLPRLAAAAVVLLAVAFWFLGPGADWLERDTGRERAEVHPPARPAVEAPRAVVASRPESEREFRPVGTSSRWPAGRIRAGALRVELGFGGGDAVGGLYIERVSVPAGTPGWVEQVEPVLPAGRAFPREDWEWPEEEGGEVLSF